MAYRSYDELFGKNGYYRSTKGYSSLSGYNPSAGSSLKITRANYAAQKKKKQLQIATAPPAAKPAPSLLDRVEGIFKHPSKPSGPTYKAPNVTVGDITSGKAKQAQQQQQAQQKNAGGPKKATRIIKDVGNFLTSSEQGLAKPVARVLPGGTNDIKAQNEASAQQAKALKQASKLYVTGKIDKGQYKRLLKINNQWGQSNVKTAKKTTQEIKQEGNPKNIALNAAGTALDLASGGLDDAGKALLKGVDKKVGGVVEKAALKVTGGKEVKALTNVGEKGVIGAVDKAVSNVGKRVVYKASDLLNSTKVGSKIIKGKDDFMGKMVTNLSPVYKALKRSDFEGRTTGAHEIAREAVGNSNRATAYAQKFVDENKNMQAVTKGIYESGKDPIKSKKEFDEYAKARSDLDLAAAGKKKFSDEKMTQLQQRLGKSKDFDKEYGHLVGYYKDLNDFRLEHGLISKEQHKMFKDDPFDYIRQQREVPDWMMQKPGGKGGGSVASITSSGAVQRRNEFASGELLSPFETAVKATQDAHIEAYRNKAAKTLYDQLDQAGEAKLLRSTDAVREKQDLLMNLKWSKPVAQKLNKTLRTNKTKVSQLQKELKVLNGGTVRDLITKNPDEFKRLRGMVEKRNSKLEPLLDKMQVIQRDLDDLHQQRSGIWNLANSRKVTVDKKGLTSLSFLDNGVENIVKVDPVVAQAVHEWDKQSNNVLMEVLRMSNQLFKYGTTNANPAFILPNFVGDQFDSAITSKASFSTHNPVIFTRALFQTINKPLTKKDGEVMDAFLKGNDKSLSVNQYTKAANSNKVANKLVMGAGKASGADLSERGLKKTYTVIKHPKEAFRTFVDTADALVGSTEKLTRIQNFGGIYRKALREGKSVDEATRLANLGARENSVDFMEMGTYGRMINNFVPYFNASIQGGRTVGRTLASRPVSASAKIATLIGMPVAASTIWNTMDSKRNGIYKTIPDYVKQNNFVIITPGAHWDKAKNQWAGVFLLKKPQGYRQFAEPVRKFIEYQASTASGKKSLANFFKNEGGSIASDFGQAFSPVSGDNASQVAGSIMPQLAKPGIESITNHNFYENRAVVPDSLKDLAPEDQKFDSESNTAITLGRIFHTSPLKIDNFIKETFGELGSNVQNSADRLSTKDPNKIGGRTFGGSIERRFYGAQGGADKTAFFDTYTPARARHDSVSKQITKLIDDHKYNQASRVAEDWDKTVEGRFQKFKQQYGDSPTYDKQWDDYIKKLKLSTARITGARNKYSGISV